MLDITRLEKVKQVGDKIIAACPACRADRHDRTGNHLAIFKGEDGTFENGPFTCIKHEDDRDHRKTIFSYVGIIDHTHVFDSNTKKLFAKQKQERDQAIRKKVRLTKHLHDTLEKRLAPYVSDNWRAQLFELSAIRLECVDAIPHDFLKCMFPLDAVLWMGELHDSGGEQHRENFKTCREWLKLVNLHPRIAPAHFQEDSFSRSSANVTAQPFIILECDDIIGKEPVTDSEKERNRQLTAALALYAVDKLALSLRAIIDTGNKSLHLWFHRPPPNDMRALRKVIAGLRIDLGAFEQSHFPLRMPHCIHQKTNQSARLLYLNYISK